MADSSTTHYELIKQDSSAAPDNTKTNSNWDTLDTTIYGIDSEAVKVSEQTLTPEQQEQAKTNIGIVYSTTEPTNKYSGLIWLKPTEL